MTTRTRSKKGTEESIASKLKRKKDTEEEVKGKKEVKRSEGWKPDNWEEELGNIRKMRAQMDAPVDTMGCERTSSGNKYTEKERRYHILVSLQLSSMTKDQTTYNAVQKLLDHGLTPHNIRNSSIEILEQLIYPVGFYKRKAQYMRNTADILCEKYDGDIPGNVDELCKLPGIGPKMAYLTMSCAWNEVVGIGVDIHVHRISNRLGWVKISTKNPEQTRKELEDWLPKEYWKEINWLLVGFGQQICLPVRPKCAECLNKDICQFPKTSNKVTIKNVKKTKK